MKSIHWALGTLAWAAAFSVAAEGTTHAFEGAYIGLGLGHQNTYIDRANVRTTDGVFSFNQPNAAGQKTSGHIAVGYGFDVGQNVNLSLNATYSFGKDRVNDSTATFFADRVQQELSNRTALYMAPGYRVTPNTLVFVKMGLVKADQKYLRESRGVALDHSISGTLFGVGIKHALTPNLHIGTEVTKYNYGFHAWQTNLNPFEVIVSAKTKQADVVFSVGYQF